MKTTNGFDLRIAGVGGQGVVTMATHIAQAAANNGLSVSVIDRPPSAMRLSPIACDVRLGREGFAPLISIGTADAVVGLEPFEAAATAATYLAPGGIVITNTAQVPTIGDVMARKPYPDIEPVWGQLREHGARLVFVDADAIAREETGSVQNANYVVLGVLASKATGFPVTVSQLEDTIQTDEARLRCFRRGVAFAG